MTTVAYKGGVLAADRQSDWAGTRMTAAKISDLGPVLLAGSGQTWRINEVVRQVRALLGEFSKAQAENPTDARAWVHVAKRFYDTQHDKDPDRTPSVLLIERGTGNVLWLNGPRFTTFDFPSTCGGIAIGSGSEYAMGAMAAGSDAVGAVRIASSLDTSSGGGTDVIDVTKADSKVETKP